MDGGAAAIFGQIFSSVGSEVAKEILVEPIANRFRYLFHFKKYVKELGDQKKSLNVRRISMEIEVANARKDDKEVDQVVKKWISEAKKALEDVENLEKNVREDGRNSTKHCRNWIWRYHLSKQIKDVTDHLRCLEEEGNKFQHLVSFTHPPKIEFYPSPEFFISRSTKQALDEIMAALKDDGVHAIGLYGVGGVGKTTLAKEVRRKAKKLKLFENIVMVVVSQTPNTVKIQEAIASGLGITLHSLTREGRAMQLERVMTTLSKVLIILDDVWVRLSLEDIGIPFGDQHKGCKILLTTRNQQVCKQMRSKEVALDVLDDDEAWLLFKKIAELSDPPYEVAKNVARECKGLPIALQTVGRALVGKKEYEWDVAYQQLQTSRHLDIVHLDKEHNQFLCLKLSYDYLSSWDSKLCFLLCSLFPEDQEIPIEDLARYAIGLGLYQDHGSLEAARKHVWVTIGYLKDCCMLLSSSREDSVKMHDVVRDFATWILSEESTCKVRIDIEFEEWKGVLRFGNNVATSAIDNSYRWRKFSRKECSGLEVLSLTKMDTTKDNSIFRVPYVSFKGVKEIKDLHLVHGLLLTQPSWFPENFQTLELKCCNFIDEDFGIGTIPFPEMKRLRTLSFRGSNIKELPEEIGELGNLRLLDVTLCRYLIQIPKNMIRRLSKLEELYIGNSSFTAWESQSKSDVDGEESKSAVVAEGEKTRRNCCLIELHELPCLAIIWLKIKDEKGLENFDFPQRLGNSKYSIHINCDCQDTPSTPYPSSRVICSRPTKVTMSACEPLFPKVRHLSFHQCKPNEKEPDLNSLGCHDLKRLELSTNQMLYLISRDSSGGKPKEPATNFSNLEELRVHEASWRDFCKGDPPEGFLKNLRSIDIAYFTYSCTIFPPNLWQALDKLESVKGKECNRVDVLFQLDGGYDRAYKKLLSHLTTLELERFPILRSIWKGTPSSLLSLGSLKHLTLHECHLLESLFSPSLARGLVNLEEIVISSCRELKCIIVDEEDQKEGNATSPEACSQSSHALGKLKKLEITSCPLLEYAFPAPYATKLLLLTKIAVLRAPNLKNILVNGSEPRGGNTHRKAENLESESSTIINYFCTRDDSGVVLPCLQELEIEGCPKLAIYSIAKMRAPSKDDEEIHRLQILKVSRCNELERIISKEAEKDLSASKNPVQPVCFTYLISITIGYCNRLRTLFPMAIAHEFLSLRDFKVERCDKLVEVFALNDGEVTTNRKTEFVELPELENLELRDLPSLDRFCPLFYRFLTPSLKKSQIERCLRKTYDPQIELKGMPMTRTITREFSSTQYEQKYEEN